MEHQPGTEHDACLALLNEHVGHQASLVTSSMEPEKGVFMCETCPANVPISGAVSIGILKEALA